MKTSASMFVVCMAVFTSAIFAAAPAPPTGVTATDGTYSDKVRVSWSAPSGATSYEVWRGTSSSSASSAKMGSPTSSPYDDTTATAGTTYYFWVKAKNTSGTSGFSSADTGYRALPAPAPPTGVAASDGTYSDKVRVSWNLSSNANSYEVWRGTSSSSTSASNVGSPTSTPYDDTTAAAGTTYYYWIKAKNTGGTSGFSSADTGYRISTTFGEYGTNYGYDQFSDPAHPWKSLETGRTDTVRAAVAPTAAYASVSFASTTSTNVSVSPTTATSASQILTNQGGASRGTAQINARTNGSNIAYYSAAAYRKVQKTVAVTLVNELDTDGNGPNRGYASTDISDAAIISELQLVYKQAVIEWTVVRRPACTVNFDIDNDGKIDVGSWMTPEMQKVRDACSSSYAFNIFLVNHPSDNSTGYMQYNQKYGFIHADNGGPQTVAHELGHGAAGLVHTPADSDNVMYPYFSSAWRLRKNQWDQLNP